MMLWYWVTQCLVWAVHGYWENPSLIKCGAIDMQFTLPSLFQDVAFSLTVLDGNGRSHYFHNDSMCGTWVGNEPDGSVVIGSSYEGCYVQEKHGVYVMIFNVKELLHNGQIWNHRKELRCTSKPVSRESTTSTATWLTDAVVAVGILATIFAGVVIWKSHRNPTVFKGTKATLLKA
ncbi:hypothetical protein GDO86_005199 [Hymenochirus boettgeri]|uniref:Zona pellucida sperm-binding protein 1/4 Ig-like domain-containing protein n=1 Tax=Hymenochirus boettgeri TaxID=247094 RepID=A0A8T2J6C3_9PIPI|nr:hypothetical protein GDO86_005199 [Hymenochirus boettgeri]